MGEASGVALSTAVLDSHDLEGKLERAEHVLQGLDPRSVAHALDLRVREGSLAELDGITTVAVSTDAAQVLGVGIGGAVVGHLGDGSPFEAKVVAVYERGLGFGDLAMAATRSGRTPPPVSIPSHSSRSKRAHRTRCVLRWARAACW